METIYIEQLDSNSEIFELIDKNLPHILIDRFWPHDQAIEWWTTAVKINSTTWLENLQVRDMEMDIQTDLVGLKKIMDLNSNHLHIYQFDRPIPDTLRIRDMPSNTVESILLKNGLRHSFIIRFEQMTIKSVDKNFLETIRGHQSFADRVHQTLG